MMMVEETFPAKFPIFGILPMATNSQIFAHIMMIAFFFVLILKFITVETTGSEIT
jgi:hypothetical protein